MNKKIDSGFSIFQLMPQTSPVEIGMGIRSSEYKLKRITKGYSSQVKAREDLDLLNPGTYVILETHEVIK